MRKKIVFILLMGIILITNVKAKDTEIQLEEGESYVITNSYCKQTSSSPNISVKNLGLPNNYYGTCIIVGLKNTNNEKIDVNVYTDKVTYDNDKSENVIKVNVTKNSHINNETTTFEEIVREFNSDEDSLNKLKEKYHYEDIYAYSDDEKLYVVVDDNYNIEEVIPFSIQAWTDGDSLYNAYECDGEFQNCDENIILDLYSFMTKQVVKLQDYYQDRQGKLSIETLMEDYHECICLYEIKHTTQYHYVPDKVPDEVFTLSSYSYENTVNYYNKNNYKAAYTKNNNNKYKVEFIDSYYYSNEYTFNVSLKKSVHPGLCSNPAADEVVNPETSTLISASIIIALIVSITSLIFMITKYKQPIRKI